jgi:NAD(P)-dependent dehydrogenase (short-subunit alcohol dehydrogenase family)
LAFAPLSGFHIFIPIEMTRIALITGASSGFGLLTTITLAKCGWRVLATMRDLNRRENLEVSARSAGVLDRIEFHVLDVTHADQIAAIADLVAQRSEALHALVNNAGFAVPGFADEVTDAELRSQLDTNFFGTVAMTRAVLPQMRRQGFGHVVMVSSISGLTGFPGVSSYVASKFALEGWTESLRYEMADLGIKVVLVEPGSFETDIWTRNARPTAMMKDPDSPNAARLARWRAQLDKSGRDRANPQIVADLIAHILENPQPKLRYLVGKDANGAILMRRLLPASVFERMIVKMSGIGK